MRQNLASALAAIQQAKRALETCQLEAREDPQHRAVLGTLTQTIENLRVSEVYTIRMLQRMPTEQE